MINKKVLGLIGLSAKAGKVSFGADSVENGIRKKIVKLVIVAEDSSDRTKDKFERICKEFHIPIIQIADIETLSKTIGKNNKAIIGIQDINLSKEIEKINNGGEAIGENKNT